MFFILLNKSRLPTRRVKGLASLDYWIELTTTCAFHGTSNHCTTRFSTINVVNVTATVITTTITIAVVVYESLIRPFSQLQLVCNCCISKRYISEFVNDVNLKRTTKLFAGINIITTNPVFYTKRFQPLWKYLCNREWSSINSICIIL